MKDVVSAEVEYVDIAIVVDPVVVLGVPDEVDAVCSDEVNGVEVAPSVEGVESAENEDVAIATVVDLVAVLGMSDEVDAVFFG